MADLSPIAGGRPCRRSGCHDKTKPESVPVPQERRRSNAEKSSERCGTSGEQEMSEWLYSDDPFDPMAEGIRPQASSFAPASTYLSEPGRRDIAQVCSTGA